MESTNNTGFENITNKECLEETATEAHRQNDIPEALQEVKSPSGGAAVENVMEKLKAGKNVKEKQGNDFDRQGLKRKSESDERPALRKEARQVEPENQAVLLLLSHIPLKSLMEVEMKLVYFDEGDVTYEFLESQATTSAQPKFPETLSADSLRLPDMNILPQVEKWLQVALKDASTCYRQKKYAMAAGQFQTALELCSKGAAIGRPFEASPKDISSIASFIETKLVICYLKMKKPELALNHSH
ncbi:PREDICTED: spermatogenesis-associated protein 16-like, partial [Gekko japonicus]|uniref:Spermatogenesis-associated protein 16-like n=1 Tax=Gekko japonicus TaxID=146911 RepID=A0ABM1KRW5_GEKJA